MYLYSFLLLFVSWFFMRITQGWIVRVDIDFYQPNQHFPRCIHFMVPGVLILSVFSKASHILGLIRIRLLDTAYRNIMKNFFFFFFKKTLIFDGFSWKCISEGALYWQYQTLPLLSRICFVRNLFSKLLTFFNRKHCFLILKY